jgi:hypothetical protein
MRNLLEKTLNGIVADIKEKIDDVVAGAIEQDYEYYENEFNEKADAYADEMIDHAKSEVRVGLDRILIKLKEMQNYKDVIDVPTLADIENDIHELITEYL